MILIKHHNEGNLEPYFYFATEMYVLNHLLKGDETYFFTWRIKGIVSGKNQVIENDTMFTIITKKSGMGFSFKTYLGKIIDAFKKLGVDLEFSGRNDILLEGKKVSGNAFLQNKNGMLMHGTLMYDLDIETMVRSLTPPDEKLISKGIASVSSRVNNLKPYLNGMTHDELVSFLEKELCDQVYELNEKEIEQIKADAKQYMTDSYLYQEQPPFTQVLKKRFTWGMIEVMLDIKEGIVQSLKLHGDFFELKEGLLAFETAFKDVKYIYKDIQEIIEKNPISDYILGADNQDLLDLFKDAFLNV